MGRRLALSAFALQRKLSVADAEQFTVAALLWHLKVPATAPAAARLYSWLESHQSTHRGSLLLAILRGMLTHLQTEAQDACVSTEADRGTATAAAPSLAQQVSQIPSPPVPPRGQWCLR
jgi:hypothetical protein